MKRERKWNNINSTVCNSNITQCGELPNYVVIVVATTYHKGQMILLTSKPQEEYDVGFHKRTQQGVSA